MSSSLKIPKEKSIFLDSSFTEKDINEIIKEIRQLNFQSGDIFLEINSVGGSFAGAIKLYEAIRLSSNKVIGVVVGNCYSGAALALQACHKRYASPLSKIGVHYITLPISFMVDDSKPMKHYMEKLRLQYKSRKQNNQLVLNILYKRMKVSKKKIRQLLINESELSAKEALELNMIDEILNYNPV